MKQKSGPGKAPAEQVLKDIRRQTRRQYSAEEKIRIVLEGLRGEENISELCRREGIQGTAQGEAYLALQEYAVQLKERGIILAVCSKNDPALAEAAFRDHPEMRLKRSDIT